MAESIPPTGPGAVQPPENTNQDDQPADIHFFSTMPFTKKQFHEFLNNEYKFLAAIIRHEMQRMKKALQKMKRMETGEQ